MRSIGSALVVACSLSATACGSSIVVEDPPSTIAPSTIAPSSTRAIRGRLVDAPPSTFVRASVDGAFVAAPTDADGLFTLTAPRDVALVLQVVVDDDGHAVAGDLGYPVARAPEAPAAVPADGAVVRSAPRSTSTLLPGAEAIWLGDVTVATQTVRACAGALGADEGCPEVTTAHATPSENPLAQNDHDDDGVADIDDPDALWLLVGAGDSAPAR